MPRDLFGDVTNPSITLGTRKWYSVPLSFLVHTLAMGVLIVVPLLATGVLPAPDDVGMVIDVAPPPLPQPPPVRTVRPPQPQDTPDVTPVLEPDDIRPEVKFDPGFEAAATTDLLTGVGRIEGGSVVAPPPVGAPPAVPQKAVRVGGDVRQPERLTYVNPTYPPLALTARVQGIVIIEAIIDTEGRVQDAKVLRTASPILNDAALTAVRRWTYRPTLLNGVPVSVVMTVTVQFLLQ